MGIRSYFPRREISADYGMAWDDFLPYYNRQETFQGLKGSAKCENAYDYFTARRLDTDPNIEDFEYRSRERFGVFNPLSRCIQNDAFDFKVWNHDGILRLLLVIPEVKIYQPITSARIDAAECAAKDFEGKLEVWTEIELFGPNPRFAYSVLRYYLDRLWTNYPPTEEELAFDQEELGEPHASLESARGRDHAALPEPRK